MKIITPDSEELNHNLPKYEEIVRDEIRQRIGTNMSKKRKYYIDQLRRCGVRPSAGMEEDRNNIEMAILKGMNTIKILVERRRDDLLSWLEVNNDLFTNCPKSDEIRIVRNLMKFNLLDFMTQIDGDMKYAISNISGIRRLVNNKRLDILKWMYDNWDHIVVQNNALTKGIIRRIYIFLDLDLIRDINFDTYSHYQQPPLKPTFHIKIVYVVTPNDQFTAETLGRIYRCVPLNKGYINDLVQEIREKIGNRLASPLNYKLEIDEVCLLPSSQRENVAENSPEKTEDLMGDQEAQTTPKISDEPSESEEVPMVEN